MRPGQLYIAPDGSKYLFRTYYAHRSEGYLTRIDNRSSGLGDLWQTIVGGINAAGAAYGQYIQVRALQQANKGPSLQAQMDSVWATLQSEYANLLTAARSGNAQTAYQQGLALAQQWRQIMPTFQSLCCTQAGGVDNHVKLWLEELKGLAASSPATTSGGAVVTSDSGLNQYVLPAAIIALALILKG